MAKTRDIPKKRRRRPKTTGRGEGIMVRLHDAQLTALDQWRGLQQDVSRPEAIRRLVELGLTAANPRLRGAHKGADKAKALAGEQVERMIDRSTPEEERQKRKRRLTKGPSEFRDIRNDQV